MKKFFSSHKDLFTLSLLALIVMLGAWYNIGSWQFAYIGDEWVFYDYAKQIALRNISPHIFSLSGVYGTNPVLGSYWQAAFLKIFGINHLAWRLSNIVLLFPTTFALFFWAKDLFGRKIAYASLVFFCSSSFIFGYFKLGYTNPISLFTFTALLLSITKTLRLEGKSANFWAIISGIVMGVSYFFVFGTLFPFITFLGIICFSLFTYRQNLKFHNMVKIFLIFITALIVVSPSIVELPSYLEELKTHAIASPEYSSRWQIVINLGKSFLLYFINFDYFYNHFIYGGYFDRISQAFIILGCAYIAIELILNKAKKKNFNFKLLISFYFSTIIILSLTNPYTYTPTTRGHLLMPFGCIVAGIGLWWLLKLLKLRFYFALVIIFPMLFIVNLYITNTLVLNKIGAHRYSHIVGLLQQKKAVNIVVTNTQVIDEETIKQLIKAYQLSTNFQVTNIEDLTCVQPQNTILVIADDDPDSKLIREELSACGIREYVVLKDYQPTI